MATSSIPRTSGVYKITCTANGKIYVGSSVNLYQRHYKHINSLRKNEHDNQYLQRAWNKYGEQSFVFEIIEIVMPFIRLDCEQYWLDILKPYDRDIGFNISKSAYAPQTGRPVSKEHRAKISEANKGRIPSEETRIKLSVAGKKRKATPETKLKMSIAQKGKSVSEETKQKLSSSKTGVKWSEAMRVSYTKYSNSRKGIPPPPHVLAASNAACEKTWIVTNPDGQENIIINLTRFCKEHGLDQGHMSRVAQGKLKTHKGWKCRYYNNITP